MLHFALVFPGGDDFETSSAGAKWRSTGFKDLSRPGLHGASVLVIGTLGWPPISKPDDKHVNASGEMYLSLQFVKMTWLAAPEPTPRAP